eukprot:747559-Hanusia_phi.AAC.3
MCSNPSSCHVISSSQLGITWAHVGGGDVVELLPQLPHERVLHAFTSLDDPTEEPELAVEPHLQPPSPSSPALPPSPPPSPPPPRPRP